MTNQKLRQAWQAAIDIEPIMKNVAGGQHRVLPDGLVAWHPVGDHGLAHEARRACRGTSATRTRPSGSSQEAGYKKEPIRFMTTQEYKWMYDFALLTKQQLEDVGFNIDLQVVDWATARSSGATTPRSTTSSPPASGRFYDPTHHIYLTRSWPGWTTDEDILKLQAELARETDPKKRHGAVGAADPAVLREGAGDPLRRSLRARGPSRNAT